MATDDTSSPLPEAVPRWEPVTYGERRIGALAEFGSSYVFYACEPDLVPFDGCQFGGRAEAHAVLTKAAKRFADCAADRRGSDAAETDTGAGGSRTG